LWARTTTPSFCAVIDVQISHSMGGSSSFATTTRLGPTWWSEMCSVTSTPQPARSMDRGGPCTSPCLTSCGWLRRTLNGRRAVSTKRVEPDRDDGGRSSAVQHSSTLDRCKQLVLRTYAIRLNDFKRSLAVRGIHPSTQGAYQLARLPRFIWIVEAIDRNLRSAGKPCVVGEAVLDGTSSDHSPRQVALHVHGVMWLQQTGGDVRFPIIGDSEPYISGGVGAP